MISRSAKRVVVERARGCCEYCRSQLRFATESFSMEHISPRSHEGSDDLDNLALSCLGCNSRKYTKTQGPDPICGEVVALFHPRQQRWGAHFAWSEDCTLIIGLTATGRATIETLQLNRESLVNLRRVLYAVGEHPPFDEADQLGE